MGNEISPLLEGATMIRDGILSVVSRSKKEEVVLRVQLQYDSHYILFCFYFCFCFRFRFVFIFVFVLFSFCWGFFIFLFWC
jgi:hypothetical protein